jgi:hypothetical protein
VRGWGRGVGDTSRTEAGSHSVVCDWAMGLCGHEQGAHIARGDFIYTVHHSHMTLDVSASPPPPKHTNNSRSCHFLFTPPPKKTPCDTTNTLCVYTRTHSSCVPLCPQVLVEVVCS